MINKRPGHTSHSHVKFLLSLLLAAALLISALPVYAAEDAAPMAEDAVPTEENAAPAENTADEIPAEDATQEPAPDLDALLAEQASEYVTITVYDRSTYTFGPIQLVEGFQYPTTPDREMRIKGSGTSSNNIRISSVKWFKKNYEGEYIQDTTGSFTEGTWRCEMLLNGVSSSNIYD